MTTPIAFFLSMIGHIVMLASCTVCVILKYVGLGIFAGFFAIVFLALAIVATIAWQEDMKHGRR